MSIATRVLRTVPIPIPQTIMPRFSKRLPVVEQRQSQSNWCWAACAAMVGNYYYGLGQFTQCSVAGHFFTPVDGCCASPCDCNFVFYLDRALSAVDSFDGMTWRTSFQELKSRIDADQPVGTRVQWKGGGGHFMLVTGYIIRTGEMISLLDPFYGRATMAFTTYKRLGIGLWTHTYFTARYS